MIPLLKLCIGVYYIHPEGAVSINKRTLGHGICRKTRSCFCFQESSWFVTLESLLVAVEVQPLWNHDLNYGLSESAGCLKNLPDTWWLLKMTSPCSCWSQSVNRPNQPLVAGYCWFSQTTTGSYPPLSPALLGWSCSQTTLQSCQHLAAESGIIIGHHNFWL